MRFAKLLNKFVAQEELFPISFARLLNEFVSQKELFPISGDSISSNLLCIFLIILYRSLFCQTGFFSPLPVGPPDLGPFGHATKIWNFLFEVNTQIRFVIFGRSGLKWVAMARHGLKLWENDGTRSNNILKISFWPLGQKQIIKYTQTFPGRPPWGLPTK